MPSARQTIEMEAAPAAIMAVLTDFAGYHAFLPEIRGVEQLEAGGDRWDVRFRAHVIRPFQYVLRLRREGDTKLSWSMLSGIFVSNDGSWELEPLEPAPSGAPRTRVTYSIDLVLGVYVPQALVNSLVGESLPATLRRFAQRVQASAAEDPAPETPA